MLIRSDLATAEAVFEGTEQLVLCQDRDSGLRAVIAVDDTTLGPGLGGVRWASYPSEWAAVREARRLARVMTLKNACAELPYGGAKSVILNEATSVDRTKVLRSFGRYIAGLSGAYLPGVDMNTTVDDMAVIGTTAPDVTCDHIDPSPMTALGVFAAIVAGCEHLDGSGVAGKRVVVQGVGHVGERLAHHLADAGAEILVADVNPVRAHDVARSVEGRVIDVESAPLVDCDVFAPCATARVITNDNVDRLPCRLIAGAANDVLEHRDLARHLAQRAIAYVPDFLTNAGGVICIHAGRTRWDEVQLETAVRAIGTRVAMVMDSARRHHSTPLEVAEAMASVRLGHSVALPG